MTYALLAKVNDAEEAADRGAFMEAVRIQIEVKQNCDPLAKFAADLIDAILLMAMHERACKFEVRQ